MQILLHSSYTGENDLFLYNEIRWMETYGHFAGMSGREAKFRCDSVASARVRPLNSLQQDQRETPWQTLRK
jgi:hypothetical protein